MVFRKKLSIVYLYLFFSVYLFLLFVVLFTKAPRYQALILNPIDFLMGGRLSWLEALLNVCYFIPLGLLYGMKARYREFVIVALLTIVGIEMIQFVFYLGTFAISDIFLNFIGCLLGYHLYQPLHEHFQE
nr:VanZ family protein [Enterococcus faecium]